MKKYSKVLILENDIENAMYLKNVLESVEFKVVGIGYTCHDAYDLFVEYLPDLIVCCIYLDNGDIGINFVEQSRTIKNVPIIYISAYADEETLNRAMDSSQDSYITKPFTPNQLIVSAKRISRKWKKSDTTKSNILPTKRELEIIQHLACGESSKKIADLLCVSYETIKSHRKNIYKKFNVSSSSETIALAYQNHWLS